ncbi:CRISPR-associated (Cas) DxTHG family [Megamonas hypermegale]|uniref:CRISPR-associated (Cas) DxTHG family n=1 Tax=Megamonas hypermegale TaxID=158847 RepID=A0A239U5Y1_9FIRM|nr:TM1812 family CRISPR-associated protein [Megamonas hypermegale]SNV05059.1 CRISPR-associated (Cas) DxTHG family [Megamonas hypermegale]
MVKNIVLFIMSLYRDDSIEKEYTDDSNLFKASCKHTNETALKYIAWKLNQEQQQIDEIYAFISEQVRETSLDKFKELIQDEYYKDKIIDVPLYNNGEMKGSFKSISEMFDKLQAYKEKNPDDTVVIHVDMTGGLRHASMLMLALIRMLKYIGMELGLVLYVNFNTAKIENASDIMDMFTLLGGAEEFNSFGSVNQIQNYFDKLNSKKLRTSSSALELLLEEMRDFSEAIKVCTNYKDMTNVLSLLNDSLKIYKRIIKSKSNRLSEQELFFAKLILVIEKTYADILPKDNKPSSVPAIIKWCAKRDFLQAAITFYTEWIPVYLIENKLVIIKDASIEEECRKNKAWSNWQVSFFKNYRMSQSSQIKLEDVEEYELTYSTVRGLIESDLSANKILGKVKDKNKKFSDFLKETIDFIKKTTRYRFYKAVVNLSNNSILKQILRESMPKNENDFEVYLTRRLIKENSNLEAVVLNSVKGIEKNRVREIFDLKEDKKLTTVEKSKERREMFKEMLEKNIIETKLPKERLLQFVEEYSNYVNDWRNQVSHANSLAASRESNFDIAQAIINSVNLIDEKF